MNKNKQHLKKTGLSQYWRKLRKVMRKLLKRKHPYAPVNYLGRKRVQKILGADIKKRKQIQTKGNDD